jgi:hypothetical protein
MHHIRKLGSVSTTRNGKAEGRRLSMILGAVNRKQIPVCEACHDKIHSGKYDGLRLSQLVRADIAKL